MCNVITVLYGIDVMRTIIGRKKIFCVKNPQVKSELYLEFDLYSGSILGFQ